jgi:peptidoglycan/xylan/chitin deacetylase (PgdA/CDA1 family)
VRGINRLRKEYKAIRRKVKPGGIILMYHRVVELNQDPFELTVSPENFNQHLEYIQQNCIVMRLVELVEALDTGKLPNRAVAITFDDGYIDNLKYAYPLLKSKGIPATLFVPSASIGSEREFWWDDLERIFLVSDGLPVNLNLEIKGQHHEWGISSKADRQGAHKALHRLLKPLENDERLRVIEKLVDWANIKSEGRHEYLPMTVADLDEIQSDGLVEIGAHTVTHPALSSLPREKQRMEIVTGRQKLVEIIGKPVNTFAYPYGKSEDFTSETVDLVREIGFDLACTTIPGSVESGDNIYQLDRCGMHNWDVDAFEYYLENFFIE